MPNIPSPTSAGVLGIALTTATPAGSAASIVSIVMPAASETTVASGRTDPAISSSSASTSCGLTTMSTTSASVTASALPVTVTPYASRSSAARSSRFSEITRSAAAWPDLRIAASRVSPITPAPRIAIR